MNTSNKTANQLAQAQKFDELDEHVDDVDFDHFSQKKFGPWNPYWFVHNFVEQYRTEHDQRLLSFGCGTGSDALRYAKMGYQVYGFDISKRRVSIANALAKKHGYSDRATFSVQSAESLDFPSDFFDIVVGVNILHHIDAELSLMHAARVLKKGGPALFKEPLATPARDRIRNSKFVTWFLPKGVKSIPKQINHHPDETGEHKLTDVDAEIFRKYFSHLTIEHWRLLTLLNVFISKKTFLEKCDWRMFSVCPFLRQFGDQAVFVAEK